MPSPMLEARATHHEVICSCEVDQTFTVGTTAVESESAQDLASATISWTGARVTVAFDDENVAGGYPVSDEIARRLLFSRKP